MLAAPRIARAQAQRRLPVLGILMPVRKPPPNAPLNPFGKRLEELGWIDGKTISIVRVYSEDNPERLPELAASLVANKVDVIWTLGPLATVAAARATTTIPIVFWQVGFPVEQGLIDSFARPGRNVTGLAWFADESIFLKRIQLLRELAPDARRHVLLSVRTNDPTVSGGAVDVRPLQKKVEAACRDLGFEPRRFELSTLADVEPTLAAIAQWAPNSMSVVNVPLTGLARKQIVDFARRHRLLDMYETVAWTQAGGLVSYGITLLPTLLRTADMVDRILRGAKPAHIPVELPSHYELTVNLATAKSLGIKVPQSILARADVVIE